MRKKYFHFNHSNQTQKLTSYGSLVAIYNITNNHDLGIGVCVCVFVCMGSKRGGEGEEKG